MKTPIENWYQFTYFAEVLQIQCMCNTSVSVYLHKRKNNIISVYFGHCQNILGLVINEKHFGIPNEIQFTISFYNQYYRDFSLPVFLETISVYQ